MSPRWRAADGVASKGHDAWGSSSLLSHFNLDQHHLLQMLNNLDQRSAWWNQNPSFGPDYAFSNSYSSKATCWFKQHWLRKKASNSVHCVSAKLGCMLLALRCSYWLTRPHRVVSSNRCWKHAEHLCVFSWHKFLFRFHAPIEFYHHFTRRRS